MDLMRTYVSDYINGVDSLKRYEYSSLAYNKNLIYGINFYDYIADYFCDQIFNIDIRPFHVLCDHKVLMNIRLNYLRNAGICDRDAIQKLKQENELILQEANALRNLALKYNMTVDSEIRNKVKNRCLLLKQKDLQFFNEFLELIENDQI
jgi:hypothetical protein